LKWAKGESQLRRINRFEKKLGIACHPVPGSSQNIGGRAFERASTCRFRKIVATFVTADPATNEIDLF
jgi:hypothetical protein